LGVEAWEQISVVVVEETPEEPVSGLLGLGDAILMVEHLAEGAEK